jgi:DNA repair protein RecO (recombination protein O)
VHWSDAGIVLSARRHGENSLVVQVLTEQHGRHGGLAKGGLGKAARGLYQPGNHLACEWSARLPEHLGNWHGELRRAVAADLLDRPAELLALSAACAMLTQAAPEREPHPGLFHATALLLDALAKADDHWPELYVRWELGLISELGFGLDLSSCAATGATDSLTHVSPRSGRAVSAAAAGPYKERLFRLPQFLAAGRGGPPAKDPAAELHDGLALTGFFLDRRLFQPHGHKLPQARARLVEHFAKAASASGI